VGRRYSARDIALVREVQRLSNEGVNLEGIKRVLELEREVGRLRSRLDQLEVRASQRSSRRLAPDPYRVPTGGLDRHLWAVDQTNRQAAR
jgi:MerR family transcriptional regulator/heat shock protein HspR